MPPSCWRSSRRRQETLQVSVVLGAAQTLFGPASGGRLEERGGVRRRKMLVCFLPFLLHSRFARLGILRSLLARQRTLHDDGGLLPQVLACGWLGRHDGLGAMHPGRGLAVEVPVCLLPASQLGVMLLLDVLLRHLQVNDLKHRYL